MNYGKLTAGTTKTAIDTAKPSEKGEIITYLSRMGDVLHDVEEGGKLVAVLVVAVHAVGDGDRVNAVLPEEHLRVKAVLQIITTRPAHILDDHMGNLARLNVCDKLFPCRTLKIAAAPAVVGIMVAVGVASLPGIAFEVFFLIMLIDLTQHATRCSVLC